MPSSFPTPCLTCFAISSTSPKIVDPALESPSLLKSEKNFCSSSRVKTAGSRTNKECQYGCKMKIKVNVYLPTKSMYMSLRFFTESITLFSLNLRTKSLKRSFSIAVIAMVRRCMMAVYFYRTLNEMDMSGCIHWTFGTSKIINQTSARIFAWCQNINCFYAWIRLSRLFNVLHDCKNDPLSVLSITVRFTVMLLLQLARNLREKGNVR